MTSNRLESNGDELRQLAQDFERLAQERQRYIEQVASLVEVLNAS